MSSSPDVAIAVRDLRKVYQVPERDTSLRAAAVSLFNHKTRDVEAVKSISFDIQPGEVVFGLGVLVVSLTQLGTAVGFGDAILFVILLIAGTVMVYSFLLMLSTCSFWFVKLSNILVIFNSMFENAGRWPITIYPGWFRVTLTVLIPVAVAITVPAQSLTGRLDWQTTLLALGLTALFAIGSRWFWKFGLTHYTGASA